MYWGRVRIIYMKTPHVAILIGGIVIIGFLAYFIVFLPKEERRGTEQLTAEQVIDLEVQAEQEYLKTQNQ